MLRRFFFFLPLGVLACFLLAASTFEALSIAPPPVRVLVTGASGKTGRLVWESLLDQPEKFDARALVRSEKSAKDLRQLVPQTGLDQVVICDVTELAEQNCRNDNSKTTNGRDSGCNTVVPPGFLEQSEAMIICTSAMPVVNKWSLTKAFLKTPLNLIRGKKLIDFRSFKFDWKGGQYPELVDFHGQKAQIDLAKALGVSHVVVVGSMGGTDPNNFLNNIGKNKDGSGHGDILLWKRKAERYLTESGLDYTIIHPGGLKDDPAGAREFVIDVDDKLIAREQKSIARADVANLCVAALTVGKGRKIAFDVITQPPSGTADGDDDDEIPTAEQALEAFLAEKRSCNYVLN